MIYEWDERKNQKNYRKHGVWFEEAQTIWQDPFALEFYDVVHSADEERFIRIGYSAAQKILVVVFCERHSGKSIRIISARKATSLEKGFYEKRV
ncbi:BrnT family toxin [Bdellovibrio bacteriovorus]|uniref:BrnT family toxin n=1 Tax=Bdellovibrio TaxID=958 RepID=UPI0035A91F54